MVHSPSANPASPAARPNDDLWRPRPIDRTVITRGPSTAQTSVQGPQRRPGCVRSAHANFPAQGREGPLRRRGASSSPGGGGFHPEGSPRMSSDLRSGIACYEIRISVGMWAMTAHRLQCRPA